jgi:hypothetical protein
MPDNISAGVVDKLSAMVNEQLPEFVQSDHSTFVTFLEAYYEYLEQENKALEVSRTINLRNDIDRTVDEFVTYFKKNYLIDIPDNILADKRLFLKHVKDFYQAKGTSKSVILLFRMLFNEEVELYYPKNDMLRVSDGQFSTDTIINLKQVTGPTADTIGNQIVQENNPFDPDINRATALVENVLSFAVANEFIHQFTLTDNTQIGTFVAGQTVTISTSEGLVTGVVDEIITGYEVAFPGAYYTSGDTLITSNLQPAIEKEDESGNILTEGGDTLVQEPIGSSAQFDITATGRGGIDKYYIVDQGSGYQVGDELTYSETNLGTNSQARVSRVAGAILMENGSDFITNENGTKILDESDSAGNIYDIQIIDEGVNYASLPLVDVDSDTGSGAKILAGSTGIGRVTGVSRTNLGTGYAQAPLVVPIYNIIVGESAIPWANGETIRTKPFRVLLENSDEIVLESGDRMLSEDDTFVTGQILSIDNDRNLIKAVPTSAIPPPEERIGTKYRAYGVASGAEAPVREFSAADIRPTIGTVSRSEGVLFGANGRISESSKSIQDSFYYQDFSYVIKVGQSINVWRDAVKRILHPVGLALFGEVSVRTSVKARVYGGSSIKLNSLDTRFRELKQIIETTLDCVAVPQMQKLELEIFTETAKATLFPTRLLTEDGYGILLEDSFEVNSNKGKNYLRGEENYVGTEPGAVIPKLQYPSFSTPMANIDATMQFLKDVTLFLREGSAAFDNSVNVPASPDNATADGNQSGRTDATPDVTILLQTFEEYINDLTVGHSTTRVLEIYKEIANIAQSIENTVVLLLPTIESDDDLKVLTSSKTHLIINSVLQDRYLTESFGSARLGPTGYSFERFKFLYPPYTSGTRTIDRGGQIYRSAYDSSVLTDNYTGSNTSNDDYWDTYSNFQIKHIEDLKLEDLVDYPGRKTNFTFDSEIILRD